MIGMRNLDNLDNILKSFLQVMMRMIGVIVYLILGLRFRPDARRRSMLTTPCNSLYA